MKKLGILLVTIILTFACTIGSIGCKKKELDFVDYFEDKVTYGIFTNDTTSEYYDAEKGYGVLPHSENYFHYLYNQNPGFWQGVATDKGGVVQNAKNYTGLVFTPRTNIHEVELVSISFDFVTDIDCELWFEIYPTISSQKLNNYLELSWTYTCKAGEVQNTDEISIGWTWTEEEAQKTSWGERKKVEILLCERAKQAGVKWDMFNVKFNFKKVK